MNVRDAIRTAVHHVIREDAREGRSNEAYYNLIAGDTARFGKGDVFEIGLQRLFCESFTNHDPVVTGYLAGWFERWHNLTWSATIPAQAEGTPERGRIPGIFTIDPVPDVEARSGFLQWDPREPRSPSGELEQFRHLCRAPFVIGPCSYEKLYWQLFEHRAFVRWPTGANFIYLVGIRPDAPDPLRAFMEESFDFEFHAPIPFGPMRPGAVH